MGQSSSTAGVGKGETFDVEGQSYYIKRKLAEGGFSYVYLASQSGGDGKLAVKRILAQTREQLQEALWEIEVMKMFDHPNLLRMISHVTRTPHKVDSNNNAKEVLIFLPYHKKGAIFDILTEYEKEKKLLTERQVLQIFVGACEGLKQLHDKGYAHRDLKPHNILLSDDGKAILMDFGSTKTARVEVKNRLEALNIQEDAAEHCSAPFRAPELYDCPSHCTIDERTDIWSLGCTLYALCFWSSPFEKSLTEAGGSLAMAVMAGNITFPLPEEHHFSKALLDLIPWMCTTDPSKRPFITEVIEKAKFVALSSPPPMKETNPTPKREEKKEESGPIRVPMPERAKKRLEAERKLAELRGEIPKRQPPQPPKPMLWQADVPAGWKAPSDTPESSGNGDWAQNWDKPFESKTAGGEDWAAFPAEGGGGTDTEEQQKSSWATFEGKHPQNPADEANADDWSDFQFTPPPASVQAPPREDGDGDTSVTVDTKNEQDEAEKDDAEVEKVVEQDESLSSPEGEGEEPSTNEPTGQATGQEGEGEGEGEGADGPSLQNVGGKASDEIDWGSGSDHSQGEQDEAKGTEDDEVGRREAGGGQEGAPAVEEEVCKPVQSAAEEDEEKE